MKKIIIVIMALLIIMPVSAAAESNLDESLNEVIDEYDFSGLQEYFDELDIDGVFSDGVADAVKHISENGFTDITFEEALNILKEAVKHELGSGFASIIQVVAVLAVLSVIKSLNDSFDTINSSDAVFFAAYLIVSVLCASVLTSCVTRAVDTVTKLGGFLEAITPILISLLTAVGGVNSSALLSPTMAAVTGGVFAAMKEIVFPVILVSAVLSMISGISSSVKLTRLSELIESVIKWGVGAVMAIFVSISALKGFTGGALDGLSVRTAKYALDKGVPVIGGMVSDTFDTLVACSVIVKNSVGTVGLVAVALIVVSPLAYLAVNAFMFKLAAAIAEPIAGDRGCELLGRIGSTMALFFAALLACSMFAFISIAMIMGASNINIMMR